MRPLFILIFLWCAFPVFGQQPFKDPVFERVNRLTMTYADTLKTDVYFVPGLRGQEKSPLLLHVHGGGFSMGTRDGELESGFAIAMAQRGYVVASISYDLTRKGKAEGFGCNCPASEKLDTFTHVVGNIHQALDYLLSFANEFNFDPGKVVLSGSSAGAEAVLHAVYGGNHEAFSEVHRPGRKFAAVIAFAGALMEDVEVNRQNGVPAFMVHGTEDRLVPYAKAPHHYCGENAPGYMVLQGSATIADALEAHKVPSTLITVDGGGHEWANKAYELTGEVSAFLYKLLIEGVPGTERKHIAP